MHYQWLISVFLKNTSRDQLLQKAYSALSKERELRRLIFLKFYFKFIAVSHFHFCDSLDSDEQSKWFKSISRFVGKIYIHFLIDFVVGVAVLASQTPSIYSRSVVRVSFWLMNKDLCKKALFSGIVSFSEQCLIITNFYFW